VGLCPGLVVSQHQPGDVRRSSTFILAQVAWICRINGEWTDEYSARKGRVL
jgi:hypothetical protein